MGEGQHDFLLQRAQPAMVGLIDGSLSTLAPIFGIESPPVATTRAGARNSADSVRTTNSVVRWTSVILLRFLLGYM